MKIHLYEVWVPELAMYAKFKSLPNEMVSEFLTTVPKDISRDDYLRMVLGSFIVNMHTELASKIRFCDERTADDIIQTLYNGCVMLHPSLDGDVWSKLAFETPLNNGNLPSFPQEIAPPMPDPIPESNIDPNSEDLEGTLSESEEESPARLRKRKKRYKIQRTRFMSLKNTLSKYIIGQDEAIDTVCNSLTLSYAGMNDKERPLGVFLFAGASGVGKTSIAKVLQRHLYDAKNIVRVDCGEFQHKHDNHKLLGAPPGYLGFGQGGSLYNQMKDNSPGVLLLDEVEKAHPDLFSTFLRLIDEGILTDSKGHELDFRDFIVIMTTNLGNDKISASLTTRGVGFTGDMTYKDKIVATPSRDLVERETKEALRKHFKPEFLNRVDSIVTFNHLTYENFRDIARLEFEEIQAKMGRKRIGFDWDEQAVDLLVELGIDTIMGARGLAQARREHIELPIAEKIVTKEVDTTKIVEVSAINNEFGFTIIDKPEELDEVWSSVS